jgi:iron(III) transport system ATP-binding protein
VTTIHSSGSTNPTLAVSGLGKTYAAARGTKGAGIADVAFELPPGTFFTLLGPSGCGKTTTLRSIAGLERPDVGTISLGNKVFFDGSGGVELPLNRRNIGMVFQSYAIWPHMSVFENVAFPLRVNRDRRYPNVDIKRMVGEALEMVELAGLADRPATRLSGGQQQRVALARAVVRQPSLLLLDEPLSNLDAKLRDEMRLALKQLQARIGVTTIYVTHDQTEALELSDSIAVMSQGRIVQLGSPQDIYFRPANTFVADFMGATNLLAVTHDGRPKTGALQGVRLSNGTPLVAFFPHSIETGESALSIRPEAITLSASSAPERDRCNRITGTVVSASFTGPSSKYLVDAGGTRLQATSGNAVTFEPGAAVALDFPYDATVALARS